MMVKMTFIKFQKTCRVIFISKYLIDGEEKYFNHRDTKMIGMAEI